MNRNPAPESTPPRRRRRRWLPGIIITFLLVFGAVTALWFTAEYFLLQGVQSIRQREAARGRQWTCEGERTAGFPFALVYGCARLTLTTQEPNGGLSLAAGGLAVTASLLHPMTIRVRLAGPVNLRSADGAVNLFATARDFAVDVGLGGRKVTALKVTASDLVTTDESASAALGRIAIERLVFDARPAEGDALALDFALDRVETPLLTGATGVSDPASISLTALIDKFSRLERGGLAAALADWSAAQGQATIRAFSASQGSTSLSADGVVSLDDQRRLRGNLAVAASGMAPLLKRWGVTMPGGMLGNLLGGAGGPSIKLPLTMREGAVYVGPLKTPVTLRPLY